MILCGASLCLSLLSVGQHRPGLSLQLGLRAGMAPGGYFEQVLGGDLRLESDITPNTSLMLTSGFSHFFEKDKAAFLHSGYGSPYNVIPLKLGAKTYINNWYLAAEAGAGLSFEGWTNSFVWSPSIGYSFANGLDAGITYEDFTKYSDTRQIALRLAYGVHFRRKPAAAGSPAPVWKPAGWGLEAAVHAGGSPDNNLNLVLGGELRLQRRILPYLTGTFTTGFTHYFDSRHLHPLPIPGMDIDPDDFERYYNIIPLKGGVKFYPKGAFYVGGEAGMGISTNGNSSFVFSPAAGVTLNNRLDIAVKYESYTVFENAQQLGIRLAYGFQLSR